MYQLRPLSPIVLSLRVWLQMAVISAFLGNPVRGFISSENIIRGLLRFMVPLLSKGGGGVSALPRFTVSTYLRECFVELLFSQSRIDR